MLKIRVGSQELVNLRVTCMRGASGSMDVILTKGLWRKQIVGERGEGKVKTLVSCTYDGTYQQANKLS